MNRTQTRPEPPSADATGQTRGNRRDLLVVAALLAGTLLVYAQVWDFGFITVDDPAYVAENPHVREGVTRDGLIWSFTAVHDANWIPLTWLSLMLDAELYGLRAGGFHLTNVFLHAASAIVLFLTLVRATGSRARSAFVAALFALHPLHVESVAWVTERKDVLSTLLGLVSLFAYLRYATMRRRRVYVISFLFFLLSLMTKQALVTLPFVFLLLDFWPLERFGLTGGPRSEPHFEAHFCPRATAARLIVEKLPFVAVSAAFSVIALVTQSGGGAMAAHFPLRVRVLNAIVVYVAYLEKAVYPQNLAFYYPHPGVRLSWSLVAGSATVLLAITAAAIVRLRRDPCLFVGWFWYVGTLVPTIGLVQIGIQQMADRYAYFPLIGVWIALAWTVPELVPTGTLRDRVLPVAAWGNLLLLAATTFSQVSYWHDSVTLLRHSMDCTPESSHAHELLGDALLREGAVEDGVNELEKAVELAAPYAPLHYELAVGLERLGRLDEAAKECRAALLIDERFPDARERLEKLLHARGRSGSKPAL